MADGEQQFGYKQLEGKYAIRLLRVSSKSSDPSRIEGELIHDSLENIFINYVAISYFWGDPTPMRRIWLSETQYLPINASAAYILERVRGNTYFWIDSICINQRDDEEKSRQVSMMWGIFRTARRVSVWLGGLEDGAELAMQLIGGVESVRQAVDRIEKNSRINSRIKSRSKSNYITFDSWLQRMKEGSILWAFDDQPDSKALLKLLSRPWFRRVWVIQEVVAAREVSVTCDHMTVPWDLLEEIVGKVDWILKSANNPRASDTRPGIESVLRIATFRKELEDSKRNSMQMNLMLTTNAEATDPRDKIFAIRSFSAERNVPEFLPKYSSSVEDVFVKATYDMLVRDQSPRVLHMAGIGFRRSYQNLPSWVPDYSLNPRIILGAETSVHQRDFLFEPDITETPLLGSLKIKAIVIDTVTIVLDSFPPGQRLWDCLTSNSGRQRSLVITWFSKLLECLCPGVEISQISEFILSGGFASNLDRGPSESHVTSEWLSLRFEYLLRILIAGQSEAQKNKIKQKHFDAFLAFLLHISKLGNEDDLEINKVATPLVRQARVFSEATDRLAGWSVFATKKGYLGRGPPLCRNGDRICGFGKAKTPFIIREVPASTFGSQPLYALVGECFIGKLMDEDLSLSFYRDSSSMVPLVLI